ncbi:hypothetical protein [Streptomyces albicerus]|uniref:hypothetical protein n=1 Tax=Streptomyces albicerus TaxID=2569859 RepID=UPI00124B7B58|nr:hypothetical protein [Streptomyces albicerus]
MGRDKPKKPRRPRTPGEIVNALADAYRCSHCHSETGPLVEAVPGIYRLEIQHDDSCPVRRGVLPDLPDLFRAIDAA